VALNQYQPHRGMLLAVVLIAPEREEQWLI
jgi:hypothetical protein